MITITAHRWLICGSRDLTDERWAYQVLDAVAQMNATPPLTIISGAAPGADSWGAGWALKVKADVEAYGAKWRHHGRSAGPIRNQQMLTEGQPDLVVALCSKPLEQSRGTHDMVKRAHKAGIPVVIAEHGSTNWRWEP